MKSRRAGFTLVELLVVIAIVLLVAIVAMPAIYSSLSGRQVTDAARIFTGGLVGARDSAIKYNAPRGIRLLPDPVLTIPAPGAINKAGESIAGTTQLCYNRFIPIEPAGDYSQGMVSIGPQLNPTAALNQAAVFPPFYPRGMQVTNRYPYYASVTSGNPSISQVLMVEESPYVGGYVVGKKPSTPQPNSPTTWYWNIRVGDKIKIGGSGRAYTVVGPLTISPWGMTKDTRGNPELFVNVGQPGTPSPLTRTYYFDDGTAATPANPEFLFLVNGEDDDADGFVDEGWDGFNQDADLNTVSQPQVDEIDEWERENWLGSLSRNVLQDTATGSNNSPSADWVANSFPLGTHDAPYLIKRRPVPSPGAREVMLPPGLVIDATTWDSTQERSRIPVSPGSLYCDIMVDPNGLYIPTTAYSAPTSANPLPFLHFWITDREDVHARGSLWGFDATGLPKHNPSDPGQGPNDPYVNYQLPMPAETPGYTSVAGTPVLKADRRLVTMFTQSGLVTTNTIESVPALNAYQPGEGFSTTNLNYPYLKAQKGQREAR